LSHTERKHGQHNRRINEETKLPKFKYASRHEDIDTGGTAAPVLNFGTICFVSMTSWPLYTRIKYDRYNMNGLHAQVWSGPCGEDKIGYLPREIKLRLVAGLAQSLHCMSYYGINAPAILTVSIGKYARVGGLEDVRVGVSSNKERIHAPSRN